ncbi:MAG: hypothetical protein LBM98_11450 [Oscillospiraceae bacterium]|nr:hypothetical protein [Oscillospiraceae bacterium]
MRGIVVDPRPNLRPTSRRTVIASRAKQSKPSNPRPSPRPTYNVQPASDVQTCVPRPTSRRRAPSLRAPENLTYKRV